VDFLDVCGVLSTMMMDSPREIRKEEKGEQVPSIITDGFTGHLIAACD
jgi:hypothetical protein